VCARVCVLNTRVDDDFFEERGSSVFNLFSENNRSVGSFLLLGGEFFFSKQDRETTGHEEREA